MTWERRQEIRRLCERFSQREHSPTANAMAGVCLEVLDELERLKERTAIALEVSPWPPPPKEIVGDPMGQVPYSPSRWQVVAKMANPKDPVNNWIGAAFKTMHTVVGSDEDAIRRRLEDAVGRG